MWYDALEVAKYIITRCLEDGCPISNLKLQKVLYFLWVDFYRETHRYLFFDEICAWQLGPVIPDVYYEYCPHAGRPIFIQYEANITDVDKMVLDRLIQSYMWTSASTLVSRTHEQGTAWDIVYRDGRGNRDVIPFSLIIEKEVG